MAVAAKRTVRRSAVPLTLVEPPAFRPTRAQELRWRSGFRTFNTVLLVLFLVAGARVALTVKATEASITASALEQDIKAERAQGDSLEMSHSSLATPSRIREIAGTSLEMAEPGRVDYLEIPEEQVNVVGDEGGDGGGLRRSLARVMGVSLGDVRGVLVGDLGASGAR